MKTRVSLLKKLAAIMLVGAMAVGITACGDAQSKESSSKDESTTSTTSSTESKTEESASLVLWGAEDDQTMLKEMADAFVADHPTYTVEVRVQGEDTAKDAALNDLDATADVFAIAHDQLGALVEAGAVYPNTLYVDNIKNDCTEAALTAATYKDAVYGYPSSADTYFMYYDKSVFSEDDIKSFDKMLEVAKGAGKTVGFDMGNNYFTVSFWFANGVRLFGDTGSDLAGSTFNSPEALAVAKYISTLKGKGVQNINDGDATSAFTTSNLSAQVTGNWKANDYKTALGDNYGVAPLPTINIDGTDKQMISFSGVKIYVVKSSTKYPEAAMQLAAFVTNEENQAKRFADRALLPVNKTVAADPSVTEDPTIAAQIAQTANSIPMPKLPEMSNFWSDSSSAVTKEIYEGTITEANFQTKLDEWNALFSTAILE